MKKKLIQKWLNNELTAEEFETFKTLDEYPSYAKISEKAKHFRAPQFDEKASFEKIDFAINSRQKSSNASVLKYIAAIAAVVVIGFTIFKTINFQSDINTFETLTAKTESIELPDHSNVSLNANSLLSYVSSKWETERKLKLDGEALFEVEKGKKFIVNTDFGNVEVLGTIFNVKSRDYIFEVNCFEGSVKVEINGETYILKQNDNLLFYKSEVTLSKNDDSSPDWKNKQTILKSKSLEVVLKEFNNYYDVKFETSNVDTSVIFTGSFSHDNLEIALNSITLPLGMSYNIDGETIFLSNK